MVNISLEHYGEEHVISIARKNLINFSYLDFFFQITKYLNKRHYLI